MKAYLWDGLKFFRSVSVSGDWPASYCFPVANPGSLGAHQPDDQLAKIEYMTDIYVKYCPGAKHHQMHYRKI